MGYFIDLASIPIDQYRDKLKKKTLVPSRMILKEKLEERFSCFKSLGITNVFELQQALHKKEECMKLSKTECFSADYLTILARELKSIQSKPRKLADFGLAEDTLRNLEKYGIKKSSHLYERVLTEKDRKELAAKTGISEKEILELAKLSDLTRIQWVNATFARVLYASGYDTVEKVAKADYEKLYRDIKKINAERKLYKGNIGLNDMKICVEAAREVPPEIVY